MRFLRTVIESTRDGIVRLFTGSGFFGETITNGEIIQQHGFASRPKAGDIGIVLDQGNVAHLIATDSPDKRPDHEEEETVFYFDKDNYAHWKVDGSGVLEKLYIKTQKKVVIEATQDIEIIAAQNVKIDAAQDVEIEAAQNITAAAAVQADITAPIVNIMGATSVTIQSVSVSLGLAGVLSLMNSVFLALFNAHTHSEVETGSGNSGVPNQLAAEGTHTTINTKAS